MQGNRYVLWNFYNTLPGGVCNHRTPRRQRRERRQQNEMDDRFRCRLHSSGASRGKAWEMTRPVTQSLTNYESDVSPAFRKHTCERRAPVQLDEALREPEQRAVPSAYL